MAGDVLIRVATADDESAVSDVLLVSYPVLMGPAYDSDELAAALPELTRANPALLASGRYYLAHTTDKRAIAVGGWSHERPGTGEIVAGLAHLRHFGTHPDWTGHSIGRRIYARCEREARHEGVTAFECYSSLNAEGFYAALGFEPEERFHIRLSNDQRIPSIRMHRTI
jgi:GNAT superfamily N-acetyltransferase